ncbi:MAG TPA: regulatory protein RecX [Pseudomonadaceae bacterium]|nr:regulatory protein RecX [Pseudomonadaceae bacterium]
MAEADPVELSPEQCAALVRRTALATLARREYGFNELLQKLATRFPEFDAEQLIIPVLEQLRAENLQSDTRFLEAFVRYRSLRGCGPLKNSAELHPRRLASEAVTEALYHTGPDWDALCLQALHKKLGSAARQPLSAPARLKLQRFLLQRGFSHEQVAAALKRAREATV